MFRTLFAAIRLRLQRLGVPLSLGLLIVAALVFLLQLPPIPGIVLMVMMAAFWPVLLVNGALLGTAFEAATGRVRRAWLLLPAACYGAYFAAAAWDHAALAALNTELTTANGAARINFDPAATALVVPLPYTATYLLDHYDIGVVFVPEPDHRGGAAAPYRAYRMVNAAICRSLTADRSLLYAGANVSYVTDVTSQFPYRFSPSQFCNVSLPEALPAAALRATTADTALRRASMAVNLTTTTLRGPDGAVAAMLRTATARPLPWLPRPVAGCFLNDAAPSWNCDAGFLRDNPPATLGAPPGEPVANALAQALSLRPVAPAARRGALDEASLPARVQVLQQDAMSRALATLTRLTTPGNAQADRDWNVLGPLRGRPDILGPYMTAIVAGIERGVLGTPSAVPVANELFSLLRTLPGAAPAPYAARLDAVWFRNKIFALGRTAPLPIDAMPDRCKTPAQRAMPQAALQRDLAARRNTTLTDADLLAAYADPDCHPADAFGNSVLGLHNGATVTLDYANGHVVVAYTPGQRKVFEPAANRYSSVWVPRQSCDAIGGVRIDFGPLRPCVPAPLAPLMTREAATLPRPPR